MKSVSRITDKLGKTLENALKLVRAVAFSNTPPILKINLFFYPIRSISMFAKNGLIQKQLIFAIAWLTIIFCQVDTNAQSLRICCYNMLDRPTSALDDQNMRVVLQAIGNTEILGNTQPIDILAFQEGPASASEYTDIIANMETVFGGNYASTITLPDFAGCRTGFIYNQDRLQLVSAITLAANFTHNTRRAFFQPVNGSVDDRFFIYSIHLNAGAADAAIRANEASMIYDNANTLPPDSQIIYCGDFNISGSVEAAYQNLFEPGTNATAVETLNTPFGFRNNVSWQENRIFLPFHTQDPTGNMDDRFDAFYVNGPVVDGANFEYVKGSCTVLGNNATHNLNQSINTGTGTTGFGTQLVNFSDHLPVICDFKYGQVQPEFTSSLDVQASATHFVRQSGPVGGGAGTTDFEIEGSSNGTFASFGVMDFDLSGDIAKGNVELADNVVLNLLQDNEFFTDGGSVDVYLASPSAVRIPIDSAIQYQSGQNGLASVPASLSSGAVKLATYASVHELNGNDLPDGTEDPVGLFGAEINSAIADAISNGATVRLLVVPTIASTASTYTGFSSAIGSPSLSVDLVVDDGTTDVAANDFSLENGTLDGGIESDFDNSDDNLIRFLADSVTEPEDSPVQILFSGNFSGLSPASLTISIESFVNSPNLELSVESFNFTSGQFELIGAIDESTQESVKEIVANGDVMRFVGTGNLVLTRVKWAPRSPVLFFPWRVSVDQFKWTVGQ